MPLQFADNSDDFAKISRSLHSDGHGGCVSFVGSVRQINHHKRVDSLHYEAHVPLALALFGDLVRQATERFGIIGAEGVHRLGRVMVGEGAVIIRASGEHRHEAFLAARFLIDELKGQLPIWKKEVYADGSHTWDQLHCRCVMDDARTILSPVARALAGKHIGLDALAEKRVLLIGAGGLGCPMAMSLCALGIKHLIIADGDVVSPSNLARQFAYRLVDQGANKASLLKQFIAERYSFVDVTAVGDYIHEVSARKLATGVDVIVDGCDSPTTKHMLRRMAFVTKTPLVSASVHQQDGEVQVFNPDHAGSCLNCFYRDGADGEACSQVGVFTHICQMVAAVAVDRALSLLAKQMVGSSQLCIIDPVNGIRTIAIGSDPDCATCRKPRGRSPHKLVRILR